MRRDYILIGFFLSIRNQNSTENSNSDNELPQELVCMICEKLMTDAVLLPCCGKSFCKECTYYDLIFISILSTVTVVSSCQNDHYYVVSLLLSLACLHSFLVYLFYSDKASPENPFFYKPRRREGKERFLRCQFLNLCIFVIYCKVACGLVWRREAIGGLDWYTEKERN